jgi:hypothetical protein
MPAKPNTASPPPKRLPKSKRTHKRRLKQNARKAAGTLV